MGTQGALSCLLLAALLSSSDAGLVKKILRHRRQTPQPAEEHNLTLPNGELPVVFSHVYNINVPASSLCSVDLDAPESARLRPRDAGVSTGEQAAEQTVNGENQIVFTHRINVPRRACGCSEDLPGLKELMSRLEMLEGEVSVLRDRCGGGACCGAQVTGEVATKPYCHGHGNYSAETCGCVCEPGWKGPNCTKPACPGNCRKRGRCVDGSCVCDQPWTGSDCSQLTCPKDCYGRGLCANGTCRCDAGYGGEDCGEHTCANNCGGNGFCADGLCVCAAGFSGDDCSRLTCLNDCSDRGTCFNGMCICDPGYHGADCSQLACLNDCNSRGQCVNGRCACDVGFQGDDCADLSCPSDCLRRGRCLNGQCVCEEGFVGEDCGSRTCPSNCYDRGECVEGRCACRPGFTGLDCGELSCPGDCRSRGRCVDGQCVCDEGFTGEDCGQKACPNDCLARGRCVDGRCVCRDGYSGDDCSALACPANCNGKGRCVDGLCACDGGYEGESCAQLSCPNGCQDKGRCESGRCVCDEGFIGDDCSGVSPPKDLTVGEVTSDAVELSWNNEMLVTEYLVTYVPTSPGGLHVEFTVPGDKTAATVKELEPGIEYQINVYAVLSNKTSVPVGARVATELPKPEGVIFKSVRESSVRVTWDQLDVPFDGWEIYFRNTKEENGKMVSTLPPSQNWFLQSGLGPGQEYEVSVNIIKNGTRGPQTSKTVTTKIDGPRQLEVKDTTDSSALVVWSQPASPTDGLSMVYGPTSDPSDKTRVDIPPPDKQHSLGGLRPDTEYKVSLVSRSGGLTSNPAVATFTTALDAPVDLQTLSQTDDSVTLEWTNSQADVGGYLVKYSPISGATHGEELFPRGPGQTTRATLTGLHPGTEYGIGVTATKNERQSLPATTNAATDMDPPTDLEGIESTETSLSLRWQRPRARVGAYRLEYSSEDGRSDEVEIPGTANAYVLSNLTPGMSYTLTLSAERGLQRSTPVTASASTASFTFYLADSDDRELSSPRGSEDNVVSFAYLDPSEAPVSVGTEPDDELGKLTVSGVTPDGFDLTWKLKAHGVYDSLTVECKDARPLWDAREARLPGDASGSGIRGLNASTEYQIKLYGITGSQRSALLDAVAVTAPQPTSADGLMLSIEDAATAAQSPVPPLLPNPPDSGMTGAEPESSGPVDVLGDHVTTPTGVEGLSPSTRYDATLGGLVEAERSLVFPTTEEPRPGAVNLTTSDVTWDGFTASWLPNGGPFESFVVEVTNMENAEESQRLSLSGDAGRLALSGLRPHTRYLVGLYAMYRGSLLQPEYTEATTATQPVVGKLYISNLTAESFSISWNGTEGELDGFTVEVIDSDWLSEQKEYNVSRGVESLRVTGLRPSTDYVAYVYGTRKGSRTSPVSIVASTAEEPDLSGLVVSNVTSERLSLSWRAGGKAFDNFIVEVRESALPSQAMGRALPGEARSTVMAGLKARTSYDIKLYGSAGGQSTQALFDVATTEDVPQLGPVAASPASPHNLSLSWSAVSGHFDGFVVRVSDPEQRLDTLELRLPGEARNATVTNLADATGYDIELYGISHGRHTASVLAHAVTAPLPKVENLTISNVTPYGFRVSWAVQQEESAPSSGGFRHFHVVVTDSGWLLEPQEFTVPGTQSHLDIWGLITGIGYDVRLTGVSESGLLSRPLTTVVATEAEPEVEHLFVSDVTAAGFRLSWAADGDLFDRYVIRVRDAKRAAPPREYAAGGGERTKVLTGLASGTEYEIELYGVSLDQRSQPVTGVAQTGLSTPRGLRFSDVTGSSAVVHWSTPRSAVDHYRVTYVPSEGGSTLSVTVDGDVFEALLPDMIPGKTYQVTVSAVKGLEESDPTTDTVITALDRPRGLSVANVTDTSALLLWQPSVATVDGYVISYSADSVSHMVEHVSGDTVAFEMGSLVPGTRYTVGVHATKEARRSDSAGTEFTTGVDPPRDLTAVDVGTDIATLTWKPPQAAVSGYTLSFYSADGAIREVVLSPTASSYIMTELTGSTQYSVRLQAIAGPQRSRHVDAAFSTVGQLHRRPKDCAQVLLNGETSSGLHTVYVGGGQGQPVQVYCDMTTDDGGWTVFLRRQNGKLEFFRNWKNYTAGFGNMNDEFWLGLSNLHKITNSGHYELRVDLRDNGESVYALYDKFTIAEPKTRYKLYVGAYSGTAGDSMTYHQGRPFSTFDNDNDIAVTNCALSYKGAFWYKNCHRVNLMGKYGDDSHSKGINWFHWKGHEHSIQFAEMKIRPADYRNIGSRKKRS
ncbi:tenascin-like isoform 1-T1 [Spinachia spinachia]